MQRGGRQLNLSFSLYVCRTIIARFSQMSKTIITLQDNESYIYNRTKYPNLSNDWLLFKSTKEIGNLNYDIVVIKDTYF